MNNLDNPNLFGQFGVVRKPNKTESEFFSANPSVAGYAAPDNKVVMPKQNDSVFRNELARLIMNNRFPMLPPINSAQRDYLNANQHYANAPEYDRRATMLARAYSGDPSAGQLTEPQIRFMRQLENIGKRPNMPMFLWGQP